MSLTSDQQKALNAMLEGKNIFLTGEAGTGKSFVLREFLHQARRNVLVTAPTGIAAINVNGATLHRTFGAPVSACVEKPRNVSEAVINADTVVIDEISMCRIDLFDYVMESICLANRKRLKLEEPKPPIQLILVGDFFQLPPVIKRRRNGRDSADEKDDAEILENHYGKDIGYGFAFQSRKWHEYGIKMVKLRTVVRQKDKDFVKALNQARIGDNQCLDFFRKKLAKKEIKDAIYLCSTNAKASEINKTKVKALKGEVKAYEAEIEGNFSDSEMPTDKRLFLKKGTRIMILKNDPDGRYVNGSLGSIVEMDNHSVSVDLDNGSIVEIAFNRWESIKYTLEEVYDEELKKYKKVLVKKVVGSFTQLPMRIAYAVTIHKSQGQTFEKVNLYPSAFSPGQLYVALSRATSSQGLHLETKIKDEWLLCSEEVRKFYSRPDRYRFFKSSGGARKGSGRKGNPLGKTVVIRIPEALKEECEAWIRKKIEDVTKSK